MLVAPIEVIDGFIGVVFMILFMLFATRTRREAAKTILQTAGDFSTNLPKLKTCPEISASFSIFLQS